MFSKKATKIDEIFIVDLTLCSKCPIEGEDFVDFCGLLRKHELYQKHAYVIYEWSPASKEDSPLVLCPPPHFWTLRRP